MTDNTEALPPLPEPYEAVEQEIVNRYRVEKRSGGGFWPYCVKAGDGTMEIFIGHKTKCEEVAQALRTACLDGAFMASRAAIAQRQQVPTTAWLVEWRFNGVQWLYLWPSAPGGFSFTSDASKALRFARREDAEAALQWARDTDAARRPIGSLTRHGLALGEMLVTEHDWPTLTAAPSAQPAADDWRHLKQYGYAPGNYMSKCHRCGATPIMDKLAVTCRPCAETMHNEAKGP